MFGTENKETDYTFYRQLLNGTRVRPTLEHPYLVGNPSDETFSKAHVRSSASKLEAKVLPLAVPFSVGHSNRACDEISSSPRSLAIERSQLKGWQKEQYEIRIPVFHQCKDLLQTSDSNDGKTMKAET